MKISKRSIAAVVAGAVVASMLAVGTPANASATTITIWADTGAKAVVQDLLQKWGSDNGITINLVGKDFGKVRDILKTAVNNGNGPDILAAAPHDWASNLVNSGVLKPVTLSPATKKGLAASSLSAFTINSNGSNKLYGAPGWVENTGFFRNIKLAKSKPATWASIKNGELGVAYANPYIMYPVQTGFGAPVFKSSSGVWNSTLGMDGANGGAYAKFLKDRGTAYFSKNGANLVCDFLKGKIKYFVGGPWDMSKITNGTTGCTKGFKYGTDYVIEAFPNGPKGKSTPFIGVRGYFVTKQVDADRNTVAVTKLMNFVAGPVAGAYYFKKYSVRPANVTAAKTISSVPFQAGFAKAGVGAMPMPNIPAMDKVWGDWGTIEGKILSGNSADAAADWQTTMDKIALSIK